MHPAPLPPHPTEDHSTPFSESCNSLPSRCDTVRFAHHSPPPAGQSEDSALARDQPAQGEDGLLRAEGERGTSLSSVGISEPGGHRLQPAWRTRRRPTAARTGRERMAVWPARPPPPAPASLWVGDKPPQMRLSVFRSGSYHSPLRDPYAHPRAFREQIIQQLPASHFLAFL